MKKVFLLLYFLFFVFYPLLALGQSNQKLLVYPLQCSVDIFPKEIRYGDIVFATITLTNQGDKTILVPATLCVQHWSERDCFGCSFSLQQDQKTWRIWDYPYWMDCHGGWGAHTDGVWTVPACSLEPGKSVDIGFIPIWTPRPELAGSPALQLFKQSVESKNKSKYQWNAEISLYTNLAKPLGNPPEIQGKANYLPQKGVELYKLGYQFPGPFQLSNFETITVKPRPFTEYALLHQWFSEIPEITGDSHWHYSGTFVNSLYARNSPLKITPDVFGGDRGDFQEFKSSIDKKLQELRKIISEIKETPQSKQYIENYKNMLKQMEDQKIGQYRVSKCKEYGVFLENMKTRTPETLDRIARTKRFETELLKRAEKSDTTISPTMKEFIILRGFLVDLRYAENAKQQRATYDKLLDWIATTRQPSLWVKYMRWIVLNDLSHPEVLPPKDFAVYREKLDKHFSGTDKPVHSVLQQKNEGNFQLKQEQ